MRRLGAILLGVMLAAVGLAAPAFGDPAPVGGYPTFHQDARRIPSGRCRASASKPTAPARSPTTPTRPSRPWVATSSRQQHAAAVDARDEVGELLPRRAKLTGGLWTFQIGQSQGVACRTAASRPAPTRSRSPPRPQRAPDLTGTHTSIHDAWCGLQAAMTKAPFTLTFTDVLDPSVVARFPALCKLPGRPAQHLRVITRR